MSYKYYKWLYEAIDEKSKNLYILVGPPGVGKSTWIKKHFSDKQYKVISRDQIIEKIIFKHYGLTAAELYSKEPTPEAQKALDELNNMFNSVVMGVLDERPDNVIVDMMNADSKTRSKILDQVKGRYPEYKLIAVKFAFEGYEEKVIASDVERAKKHPERKAIDPAYILSIMDRIKADPPTRDEGFDEIQDYNRFEEKQQMKEYNHKQFIDWLNDSLKKEEQQLSNLLIESKLSKYWKARAKRRALKAERQWPNKNDRDWALSEQEKSHKINEKIYALFEKELQQTDDISKDVTDMMRRIKRKRKESKLKREAAKVTLDHPRKATSKRKNSGSLSTSSSPTGGGVKKGFDEKRKNSKTPVVSPTGQFGPGES